MLTLKDYKAKVKEALTLFGTYTFGDKGSYEVMDVAELVTDLESKSPADAAKILVGLSKGNQYHAQLAGDLICELQEWDKWDELFAQPGMDKVEW
jgi:poly(3-hydroxybutyrate) depolymerase